MTSIDLILGSYRMANALVHRMINDLSPADFHHQPVGGTNSAAWIVGHLALALRRTADRLGVPDLPVVPPEIASQFSQTGKPAGDQSTLGSGIDLVKLFDTCSEKVIEGVKRLNPDALSGSPPVPGPPLATTNGEALLFGTLHIANHVGQLSIIRRSLGKPPLV